MPFNKEAEVTIMIIINDLGVRLTHTLINGLKLVAYCNIVLLTKDCGSGAAALEALRLCRLILTCKQQYTSKVLIIYNNSSHSYMYLYRCCIKAKQCQ